MSTHTTIASASEVDTLNSLNSMIAKKVKEKTGLHPRTKVVGFHDTFSVDIATGNVYAIPGVDPETARGYLTHENGHRVAFPVSSAGSMAFTATVKAIAKNAPDEEVVVASNVVADVFSDSMLFYQGLGSELVKRTRDFMKRAEVADLGMAFKVMMYKAIERAVKSGSKKLLLDHVDEAYRELENALGSSRLLEEAHFLGRDFVEWLNSSLLRYYTPRELADFLLNPFRVRDAPSLDYLAHLAAMLIERNQVLGGAPLSSQMDGASGVCSASGSSSTSRSDSGEGRSSGGSEEQSQGQQPRQGQGQKQKGQTQRQQGQGQGQQGEPRGEKQPRGGSRGVQGTPGKEERSAEGVDIVPSKVDVTDIQKALLIMQKGFGLGQGESGVLLQTVFSRKLRESVKELIEKLKMVFAQNDFKAYEPSGSEKRKSELWLRPFGEPDEDSMLIERRKLLWKVTYRVPASKGRPRLAPVSVPERLVIVVDESGSTNDEFFGTTVVSVEAFVSLVVLAGLKYRNGAKDIRVVKFSDNVMTTYSGNSEVDAGVSVLMPHPYAGGGTNIKAAVHHGLASAYKNTALVVVTDAVIPDDVAKDIAKKLRGAIDSGKVGFVVFIVVNKESVPSIDIIRSNLSGKNAIIEQIKNADDLAQVSQGIVGHILRTYSS